MPLCDQCTCQYPYDLISDVCPNCGERIRRCPWCGETIPWSYPGRTSPCCDKPLKYIRTHGPDVPLLIRGEGVDGGPIFLRISEAISFRGGQSTVYKVAPVKQLGDSFLLDGHTPPPFLCLKEIVSDSRDPVSIYPPVIIDRLKRLNHPNVVRLHDAWSDGDRFFLLLDWVPGPTAAQRYLSGDQTPTAAILKRIGEEIIDGLTAMGKKEIGLLHGDVTPTNLSFDAEDRPVLIDMGSVQPLEAPSLPKEFTPHYAPIEFYPPNQRPLDYVGLLPEASSDRYMLGATLFALSCGSDAKEEHPETGLPTVVAAPDRARGVAQTRLGALRPDLPRVFTFWVDGLLSLQPEDRFASHEAARKALRSGIRGLEAARRSVGSGDAKAKPKRWKFKVSRRGISVGAVLFPVLFVFMVFLFFRYPSAALRPWRLPRLMQADLALHTGKPQRTLETLNGAGLRDWDAQVLLAQAQVAMGAPMNALTRLQSVAAEDGSPGWVEKALRSVKQEAAAQELYGGLRLMDRGERYPAYLRLRRAAQLGSVSAKGYAALAQLSLERGDRAGAKQYLARYLQLQPNSIKGRLSAAQLALSLGDSRGAYAHALKARQLAAASGETQVEPVSSSQMDTTLSQVASALLTEVPGDPGRFGSRPAVQNRIERIMMARTLKSSPETDLLLARYYERLGDLLPKGEGGWAYGKAVDALKASQKRSALSPAGAALLARCEAKRNR